MKILIAGLGSIGQRHLRNLAALGAAEDVLAFRVRNLPLPDDLAEIPIETFDDLAQALATGPDLALICSPPSTQLENALAAARAGCDLFIEKPISNTGDGLRELLEEVEQRRLTTLAGFNLRHHTDFRRIQDIIAAGTLGRILSARIQVGQYLPDWHPWEDYRQTYSARSDLGGGVILDLIHEIDYARALLGEVTTVTAVTATVSDLEIDTEDVAELVLQFDTGTLASVHLDYVQRIGQRQCELFGELGTLKWDLLSNQVDVHKPDEEPSRSGPDPEADRNAMYSEEMRHLLACVNGQETPLVDLQEGVHSLSVALAAKRSAAKECSIDVEYY